MEVILAVGLLAVLTLLVLWAVRRSISKAVFDRARAEMTQVKNAADQYIITHEGDLPPDVNRGLPAGFEQYLGDGSWPTGPWPGSIYDWDVYPDPNFGPNAQVSIRFCPLGQPSRCRFPDEPWAKDFTYYSSVYLCIRGQCKAHPDRPPTEPGYCVNCGESP